ncbi:hypothetical protein MJO28_000331 [Puccinia striiformis f. sp. tritici]|uniref:Uncharacterized protein n=2 Tax=Puccinia striiformis TaxID=27350 RepID=A0ACC0EXU0_9BASI|nr:hypothetical protein MJO28_000331 [Puccinia striiformis f. sp. tritici]
MGTWLLVLLVERNSSSLEDDKSDGFELTMISIFCIPPEEMVHFGNPDRDIDAVRMLSHPLTEDLSPGPMINIESDIAARASSGENPEPSHRPEKSGQIRYIKATLMNWIPNERTGENMEAQMMQFNEQKFSSLASGTGSPCETQKGDSSQRDGNQMCPVCLVEYEEGEQPLQLSGCLHIFHPSCLHEWLKYKGTCPLCRVALLHDRKPNSSAQETAPTAQETSAWIPVVTTTISRQIDEGSSPATQQPPLTVCTVFGFSITSDDLVITLIWCIAVIFIASCIERVQLRNP